LYVPRVGQACGINNSGTVVGYIGAEFFDHPFSYSGGVMTDLAPYLSSIGLTSDSSALAINDNGDIVGWGLTADGYRHAFLLTPRTLFIRPSAPTSSSRGSHAHQQASRCARILIWLRPTGLL
jgi:probable HAF family extracellular repeat protein